MLYTLSARLAAKAAAAPPPVPSFAPKRAPKIGPLEGGVFHRHHALAHFAQNPELAMEAKLRSSFYGRVVGGGAANANAGAGGGGRGASGRGRSGSGSGSETDVFGPIKRRPSLALPSVRDGGD